MKQLANCLIEIEAEEGKASGTTNLQKTLFFLIKKKFFIGKYLSIGKPETQTFVCMAENYNFLP